MGKIAFFNADTISELENKPLVKILIEDLFKTECTNLKKINYVFCTDKYLLILNKQYLNHETLTDVITFPLSKSGKPVIAEVYISIDRIKENAKRFKTAYEKELLRVIIHGALHLCGYSDKRRSEKARMREKENYYLHEFKVSREATVATISFIGIKDIINKT